MSSRFTGSSLLVFDLDGTLIDSAQDLATSVNAMLSSLRRPTLPPTLIGSYIGDGASMLVRRALGDPEGEAGGRAVTEGLGLFLAHYRVHKLDHTRLYPGVLAALQQLHAAEPKRPMAVLTNKPVVPAQEICEGLGIAKFFFRIYGGNSFHVKKPDPTGLRALVNETKALGLARPVTAEETVMIGDSAADVLTARNCNALSIGCTFGLAPETLRTVVPDALANRPEDWLSLLL